MKSSLRYRVVLYGIVTFGLGLLELMGSHFRKSQSWGTAFALAGQKVLLFAGIFALLELVYQLVLYLRRKTK